MTGEAPGPDWGPLQRRGRRRRGEPRHVQHPPTTLPHRPTSWQGTAPLLLLSLFLCCVPASAAGDGLAANLPDTTLAKVLLWILVVFLICLSGTSVCIWRCEWRYLIIGTHPCVFSFLLHQKQALIEMCLPPPPLPPFFPPSLPPSLPRSVRRPHPRVHGPGQDRSRDRHGSRRPRIAALCPTDCSCP